jgi:hypothetical protein
MYLEDISQNTAINKGDIVYQTPTGLWCQVGNKLPDGSWELRAKNKNNFVYDGELIVSSLDTLVENFQIAVS